MISTRHPFLMIMRKVFKSVVIFIIANYLSIAYGANDENSKFHLSNSVIFVNYAAGWRGAIFIEGPPSKCLIEYNPTTSFKI